jgi:Mg/Co/Ni transporter MgtE
MSQQNNESVYNNVCAALRKPLSEGGGVGLMAAFRLSTASEIAAVVSRLTPSEALTVFSWLDDVRAIAMLSELPAEMVNFILASAPPGRIAHISAEDQEHKLGI